MRPVVFLRSVCGSSGWLHPDSLIPPPRTALHFLLPYSSASARFFRSRCNSRSAFGSRCSPSGKRWHFLRCHTETAACPHPETVPGADQRASHPVLLPAPPSFSPSRSLLFPENTVSFPGRFSPTYHRLVHPPRSLRLRPQTDTSCFRSARLHRAAPHSLSFPEM